MRWRLNLNGCVIAVGCLVALSGFIVPPRGAAADSASALLISSTADPDAGAAPLAVQFRAEVYDGDAAKKPRFMWEFGDGSARREGPSQTHVYKRAGKYTAVVTVTDARGRVGRDQLDIDVDGD